VVTYHIVKRLPPNLTATAKSLDCEGAVVRSFLVLGGKNYAIPLPAQAPGIPADCKCGL
jgi:hypothetical protein